MKCKCIMCKKEFNSTYADKNIQDNCPFCLSMWYERIGKDKPLNPHERKKLIWEIHNQKLLFKNYKREGYLMGADMSEFQELIDEFQNGVDRRKKFELEKVNRK